MTIWLSDISRINRKLSGWVFIDDSAGNGIIKPLVDKLGSCGDKDHKKCEYQLRLENYDLGGIARDFELLKKAGIIEHVTKPTNYIVL